MLHYLGVEVVLGRRVNINTEDGFPKIFLTDGRVIKAGYVFPKTSRFSPNTNCLR